MTWALPLQTWMFPLILKQAAGKSKGASDDDKKTSSGEDGEGISTIVDILGKRYYCEACQKPCVVLPPGEHRPLTIKAQSRWANLIVSFEVCDVCCTQSHPPPDM